jgi:hypothetical protein
MVAKIKPHSGVGQSIQTNVRPKLFLSLNLVSISADAYVIRCRTVAWLDFYLLKVI